MVFNMRITKDSFKRLQVSSAVVLPFILTFFYIVELCIGIRTVVFVFRLWNNTRLSSSPADDVSWIMVVITILLSVITSCTVNAVSAFWNSNFSSGVRSAIFYAAHISTGGVIWRYILLLKCDSEEGKKEQAILIASLKFFFTQFFTIPLLIIHVFLIDNLDELLFDFAAVLCISISLILTCSIFERYDPCENYPHETMVLVPLLFQKSSFQENGSAQEKVSKEGTSTEVSEETGDSKQLQNKNALWKFFVWIQVLFFASGRILALGILLRLAGIYGVTILFLQVLLSILYLKFQATSLIPETLSKFKQLMRLSFLSYILVFEWQLNRDPATAYTLHQSTKHGVVYYSITTVESLFYLIIWGVTFKDEFLYDGKILFNKDSVIIISFLGCFSLIMSYLMHVSLIISRKGTFRAKIPTNLIIRMTDSWKSRNVLRRSKTDNKTQAKDVNVFSFPGNTTENNSSEKTDLELEEKESNLKDQEEYGSYRDLREYIGEDEALRNQKMPKVSTKFAFSPKSKGHLKHQTQCKSENKPQEETPKTRTEMIKKKLHPPKYLKDRLENLPSISNKFPSFPKILKRNENSDTGKQTTKSGNQSNEKQISMKSKINNTISNQLNKITSLKNIKGFPKRSEIPVKTGTIPDKITIPTIMNEYKEELPKPRNDNYRPEVPPRRRKSKGLTKEISKITDNEKRDDKFENDKENESSTESIQEDSSSVPSTNQDEGLDYGKDATEFLQCDFYAEDDDVFEADEESEENSEAYPFRKVSSASKTSVEKQRIFASRPESFAKNFCLSCPDVHLDPEEDVIYDSSLCSIGISSPAKRLKIRTISEGHDIDKDFTPVHFQDSPSNSDIEHYV